ncbi:MAG: TolC family protein [Muribaculaceae bacterium]
MKKTFLIVPLLASLMCSCGIYSKYQKVDAVPEGLYNEAVNTNLVALDSVGLGAMSWRELFTDPHLQSLIDQALAQNTDLLAAEQRIVEAKATLKAAKLAYLPSFALAPQGSVSSFDGHKATQAYQLPLTASWEVDIFGKLRNAKKQSEALVAQSQDYRQAVQSQVVALVANNYYTLLMLDEQLAITRNTAQSWQHTVDATSAMVDAGMSTDIALQQMNASLDGVRASIIEIEAQTTSVELAIAKLLCQTPRHIERGTLAEQRFPEVLSVGVPISLLSARPDVRAAERSLEQAFYATNAARSAFYPSITLSGSAGWTNNAGSMIVNPGKFIASAVGSLTQPLFARGQLNAQLTIAKAQAQEAQLQFQQTLLNAGIEVNDALTQYQASKKKAELYDQQVEALQRAYDGTILTMENGNTTYLEVLNAQQTLLSGQLQQTANRIATIQGVISVYNALGGGAI